MESYTRLNVLSVVISEVPNTVDASRKVEIQVDWIDKAICEIIVKEGHDAMVEKNSTHERSISRDAEADGIRPTSFIIL